MTELKKQLKGLNLSRVGKKEVLLERLVEASAADADVLDEEELQTEQHEEAKPHSQPLEFMADFCYLANNTPGCLAYVRKQEQRTRKVLWTIFLVLSMLKHSVVYVCTVRILSLSPGGQSTTCLGDSLGHRCGVGQVPQARDAEDRVRVWHSNAYKL